jgi:hypothetical protein
MARSVHSRRRQFGTACLTVAAAMLVLGQTLLKSSLDGVVFIFYWLTCFIITGFTLVTALLDVQAVRRQARDRHRELLENALGKTNRDEEVASDSAPTHNELPD